MAAKRQPIISGNWKMHHNHFEAIQCVQKLHYRLDGDDHSSVDVTVHPPFTDLRSIQTLVESDKMKIVLGAQNCHWEEKGAFTGEVAAPFLAKLNVAYVIVGHSERREYFGETDEMVNKKVKAVLGNGMTPIMCCGETLEEREAGRTNDVVATQVRGSLAGLSPADLEKTVVAYEPVWAIGTGKVATPQQAQDVHALIRGLLGGLASPAVADKVRIQYGGSVKPDNAADLAVQPDIDGALVGGASLKADDFLGIAKAFGG